MTDEIKRAYQKALYLLERRDYTEAEMRQELKDKAFSLETIAVVSERLRAYGFIDDRRFTEQYLRYHSNSYSKRILSMKLSQKGISSELFETVYSEMSEEFGRSPEKDALENAVSAALRKAERRGAEIHDLKPEEQNKIIASLFRKGFAINQIRHEMKKAVESF